VKEERQYLSFLPLDIPLSHTYQPMGGLHSSPKGPLGSFLQELSLRLAAVMEVIVIANYKIVSTFLTKQMNKQTSRT
jgi:hypothetical protein